MNSPIKTTRIRLGISQEELADRTGYTQGYISFLERGKRHPSPDNLLVLAGAFKCKVEDIIDENTLESIREELNKVLKGLYPLELEKVLDYSNLLKQGRR
jgi:transcriptional regulator with XRE-family HTH domain